MIKIKNIKVGHVYKVRVPNLFDYSDEPLYADFKELVLAKDKETMFAIVLDEVKVPTKDRIALLKYKMKDFIENDNELTQKYEEQIIDYVITKNEFNETVIVSPIGEAVEFIKEYKLNYKGK